MRNMAGKAVRFLESCLRSPASPLDRHPDLQARLRKLWAIGAEGGFGTAGLHPAVTGDGQDTPPWRATVPAIGR